ncbi:MoaD/ThiS family protein [Iodidimonas sp. SYSU 1G8]|uniref:MoaD/ThiS family protein n=1 Tax=Iodidimonas sp. SYSU 1G8 TaxID=3133967 RepID=UPI0031FEB2FA
MARVVLSGDLGRRFAGGEVEVRCEGSNVRRLIRALEERYPGIAEVLESDAMAVAIDGVVHQDAFLEEVGPESEVYFLPAIRGG